MGKEDGKRECLINRERTARDKYETKFYESLEIYRQDINCDMESYLDLTRATLKRPTLVFKRNMSQIYINTFHPWISSALNSNMDIQIILDAYS